MSPLCGSLGDIVPVVKRTYLNFATNMCSRRGLSARTSSLSLWKQFGVWNSAYMAHTSCCIAHIPFYGSFKYVFLSSLSLFSLSPNAGC